MIYGILGDLEVRDPGGEPVELPPRRARAVLATLLLRANRALSADDLIAAAWGDRDIDPAQLYKAVAALRKVFAAAGRPGALRTLNRYGYELRVDEDDLDMLRFRGLLRRADERRGTGSVSGRRSGCSKPSSTTAPTPRSSRSWPRSPPSTPRTRSCAGC
jgi:DNA-binding winged helix-turn-helix (wHTH) protein